MHIYLFLLSTFISTSYSLNCYVCNSSLDTGCLDSEFESHYIISSILPTPCNVRDAQFCIKTTTIYGAIMGTTRFCSSKSLGNQCQYVDFADHNRIYQSCVYTCSVDGCNSSIPFANSLFLNCFLFLTS
ncbi:unnamed protein product, partial [Hymenolepis diminuta]